MLGFQSQAGTALLLSGGHRVVGDVAGGMALAPVCYIVPNVLVEAIAPTPVLFTVSHDQSAAGHCCPVKRYLLPVALSALMATSVSTQQPPLWVKSAQGNRHFPLPIDFPQEGARCQCTSRDYAGCKNSEKVKPRKDLWSLRGLTERNFWLPKTDLNRQPSD